VCAVVAAWSGCFVWLKMAIKYNGWKEDVMAGKTMLLQGAVVPDDFIQKVLWCQVHWLLRQL